MKTKLSDWKIDLLAILAYASFLAMVFAAAFGSDILKYFFNF